jgi:cytochrome b involved in lipid metabolism
MSTQFTAAEVEAHSTAADCWMIIDGKVYDVSKFLEDHPGGEEVLTELAGQDATEAFDEIGHSPDAKELLKKFLVGELKGSPKPKAKDTKKANVNADNAGGS